MDWAFPNQVL